MNIYVGNLSFSVTVDDLRALFAEFGEVKEAKVIGGRRNNHSRSPDQSLYGFVDMPSNSEADKAIKALNGKFMDGRHIKVNPADSGRKKKKRSAFKRRW